MIKEIKILIFLIIVTFFLFCGCLKTEQMSPIPSIKFKEFRKIPSPNGIDNKGVIVIEFQDGDGDIGLTNDMTYPPYDTSSIYYYNLFITYFEKQNGVFKEIDLPLQFHSRIPYLTPRGQNKALKGIIEIEVFYNNPFSRYDTIQFQIYIVDRALNKSNVVSTNEIIVKKR